MAAGEAAVETQGLRKSFGDVHALGGVDLHVEPGVVFGCSAQRRRQDDGRPDPDTLLEPDEGSARVAFDVVRDAPRVREHIGLAGQYAAVDENLTGFENLEMVGRLYHLRRRTPGAAPRSCWRTST